MGVLYDVIEDKDGNANAEDGVDEVNTSEAHDDGTEENGEPGEAVFELVEVDGLLVEAVAVASDEGGEEVEDDAEDSKENHTAGVDFGGASDAFDSLVDEDGRGEKENDGSDGGTD